MSIKLQILENQLGQTIAQLAPLPAFRPEDYSLFEKELTGLCDLVFCKQ